VEKFDIYTKKTTLYYILQIVSMLTIISLIVAKIIDLKVPQKYYPYLIALLVLGLTTIIINMVLSGTNLVKMYKKDGEITISSNAIMINSMIIQLNNIQKIEINANDYKGAKSSDGSGNRIQILDKSNKTFLLRFVISSKDQRNKLREIMEDINSKGIRVILNG
jgi:hypothetical protein